MPTTKPNKHPGKRAAHSTSVADLVARLGSRNGVQRYAARHALVTLGERAIDPLIAALSAQRDVTRWEAAKALGEMHAARAAPALIQALECDDTEVRFLAGEALVGLGRAALLPLCEALLTRPDSVLLREGAHHVLRALNDGPLADIVGPVLAMLDHYEPELAVPLSAEAAVRKLKQRGA